MLIRPRFRTDIPEFIRFTFHYFYQRLLLWWRRFEGAKDVAVAILIVRRGKYSQSFLNTSFLLLVASVLIAGPAIADNNPFIAGYFADDDTARKASLEADINSFPIATSVSQKPRDQVIDHEVKGGETLASISKQYDVDVDSIKWATGLKSDTIKPGQTVKVPPVSGVVHTVKAGESIYSIAKKYNTDAQKIINFPFNDYADLDTFALSSGQTLIVPDGEIVVTPGTAPRGRGPQIAAGKPGTGSFIWPTSGYVSQSPVWYHMALDIANKGLPPVLAADTGTVTYAGCVGGGYGCHVRVNHGNGFETLYGHLSSIGVSPGQGVGRGQQIGNVGSTGRSTGPHLHFEIRQGGALQNPLSYLGR